MCIDEYNEATDYGISEGSWQVRCNLAEWLNNMVYGKHVDDGQTVEIKLFIIHFNFLFYTFFYYFFFFFCF